jgi:hypothetical protein
MQKCYYLLLFVLLSTLVTAGNNFVNLVMANPNVLPYIIIERDGSIEPDLKFKTPNGISEFITQNGSMYTLMYNLTSQYAVKIQCSNIVFDGAGHVIDGSNPNWVPYFNNGLSLEGVTNVTVKNLKIIGFANKIISIKNSSHCVIQNVTATSFEFYESDFNTIAETNVEKIYVYMNQSNNNIIAKNNITRVELLDSTSNTFFENNFPTNFHYELNEANFWDNGSTGNYWSNYNGADDNGDGVGDTPYVIDQNNQDNYPLMEEFIIPDFPSWIILPLFLIGTVAVTFCKMKLTRKL